MDAGDHELLERLEPEHGYVELWLARKASTRELCWFARPSIADDQLSLEFAGAVRDWKGLDDPALPRVRELGMSEGRPFAAYAPFSGVRSRAIFAQAWREGARIPLRAALEIAQRAACAVEAAHAATERASGAGARSALGGSAHEPGQAAKGGAPVAGRRREPLRAIEPDHLWVSPAGEVLLFGFQFARVGRDWDQDRTGVLRGRFSFMSPEQIMGKAIDHRSDIFALGAVLYSLITLQPPFDPEPDALNRSDIAMLERIRHVRYVRASERVPEVPAELDYVIALCLQEDPDNRYQTAGKLAAALAELARVAPGESAGEFLRSSPAWGAEVERAQRLGIELEVAGMVRKLADRSGMVLVEGPPSFYVDRNLVTAEEYARFIAATDRPPPGHWPEGQVPAGKGGEPMVHVRYGEALDYALWAGKRLPSEAEWAQAAGGALGVEDLGRVWEWTSSWHELVKRKVVRGGAWRDQAGPAEIQNRSWEKDRAPDVGFRCVLEARAPAAVIDELEWSDDEKT